MYIPKKSVLFSFPVFAAVSAQGVFASEIEEIRVTSDFRQSPEMQLPVSISVVSNTQIKDRAAQHLDEILNVAPNVNFSAGASRGRYVQIRGIGERSQFVDPINPSVGLTIDGVNLSGVGNAGTLFDVEQVEVLRGPQGTRFGANALAGMLNITSRAPTEAFEGQASAGVANHDTWRAGGVVSGPLNDQLLGRLAVEQYSSNGFIDNQFLGRDDTADRDEATVRGRLRWLAGDDYKLDAALFYVDVDNGYDGFSLDNNRTTLSDEPGNDIQETLAFSLTSTWTGSRAFDLVSTLAVEDTNIEYGYDEDWTNTQICQGLACDSELWGFDWWYSSTDTYYRDRQSLQLDLRLVSSEDGRILDQIDWVVGIYAIDQDEDLRRDFFDWDAGAPAMFESTYDSRRLAAYGELALPFTDRLTLTVGGRVEDYAADYDDSRGVVASPDETLWGGELKLSYQAGDQTLLYGLVSRGFKAGGVNGEALGKAEQNGFEQSVLQFLEDRLVFETETATNVELGLKGSYLDDRWQLRAAVFHMTRDDVQLRGWYNEGPLFVGYIDNGAKGTNQGVELETSVVLNDYLELFGALGVLDTEIEDFSILGDGGLVDKSGRDQAHAPGYQFNAGINVMLGDQFRVTVEADGKDSFYFSDSHDQQSDAYTLVHARFEYAMPSLTVALWGRNLTDKDYAVRGFYFPNDPREFYGDDHAYIQLGDPRTYGITATYNF
jgi:iron complex outermembrane recepter protein